MKGKGLKPPIDRPTHVVFCAQCKTSGRAIEPGEPIAWQRGWWLHPACIDDSSTAVEYGAWDSSATDLRPVPKINMKSLYSGLTEPQRAIIQKQMRERLEESMEQLQQAMDRVRGLMDDLDSI